MQVPIRIYGNDAQGKKFEEETATLAINAHGALVMMQARVTSGSKVQVQHNLTKEEQECHVAFLGPVRSGKAEVGLEFSDARPSFWRVAFPPEDWSKRGRCCPRIHSRRARNRNLSWTTESGLDNGGRAVNL